MPNGALVNFKKLINSDDTAFIMILLDINGLKKPNRLGHDVFYYSIQSDQSNAKIIPYGIGIIYGNTTRKEYDRAKLMSGYG